MIELETYLKEQKQRIDTILAADPDLQTTRRALEEEWQRAAALLAEIQKDNDWLKTWLDQPIEWPDLALDWNFDLSFSEWGFGGDLGRPQEEAAPKQKAKKKRG